MGLSMSEELRLPFEAEQWFPEGKPTIQVYDALTATVELFGILNQGIVPSVIFDDLAHIQSVYPNPNDGDRAIFRNQGQGFYDAVAGSWKRSRNGTTDIT